MSSGECRWRSPPAGLRLAGGEVHVWRVALVGDPSARAVLERDLQDAEIRRAGRFFRPSDRDRFIVGRALLRRILALYLGAPAALIELSYEPGGKPALAEPGDPPLEFNFTHSSDLALCGLARGARVGIDVERLRPLRDLEGLADRFFSARESGEIHALEPAARRLAFFQAWTRKEACLKATGEGLTFPLERVEVSLGPREPARILAIRGDAEEAARWGIRSFAPADGYIGAVAAEGGITAVEWWDASALDGRGGSAAS